MEDYQRLAPEPKSLKNHQILPPEGNQKTRRPERKQPKKIKKENTEPEATKDLQKTKKHL